MIAGAARGFRSSDRGQIVASSKRGALVCTVGGAWASLRRIALESAKGIAKFPREIVFRFGKRYRGHAGPLHVFRTAADPAMMALFGGIVGLHLAEEVHV
jgi:hypothetical protein